MNQKTKGPGDNVIIRLKSKEKPETLEWLNAQTNIAESIRFLIELETLANGIKNYSEIIPTQRSEQFLNNYLINELSKKRDNFGIDNSNVQTENRNIVSSVKHSNQPTDSNSSNSNVLEIEERTFEEKEAVIPKIKKNADFEANHKVNKEDIVQYNDDNDQLNDSDMLLESKQEEIVELEKGVHKLESTPIEVKKKKKVFNFDDETINSW